jgi:hypothetical protein
VERKYPQKAEKMNKIALAEEGLIVGGWSLAGRTYSG